MKLVLFWTIFIGVFQVGQSQTNPFRGLRKVKVPQGGAKSLSFEVLDKGNVTSHIEIKAQLSQGSIEQVHK